jgi:outer membrane protein W
MKKIITVIALALICSGAYAQFNQGRYLVGGSVGFVTTTSKTKTDNATTKNGSSTSFTLAPDVGYFIIDNLAVGAGLGVSLSSSKSAGNNDSKSSSSSFTLTPFVRYYLDQGIFFQGQVGFGGGSGKYTPDGSTTSTTEKFGLFSWALAAGYAHFLNDYVALEPIVGYGANTTSYNDPDFKSVSSGLFINVGLQVYLGARN